MNVRRTRSGLRAITLGAAVATAAAWFSLALDYKLPSPQAVASAPTALVGGEPAHDRITLAAFQPLLGLELRQSLVTPPPTVAPARSVPLKLTGLIAEPPGSLAVVQTADGRTELKAVGERCGEVEFLSIERDAVQVRFDGQVHRLVLPKGEGGR